MSPFEVLRFTSEKTNGEKPDTEAARRRLYALEPPKTLHDRKAGAKHFQPDRDLEIAINTALNLGAPLLLTGEPGTGKTEVAYFLGEYFGLEVFEYQVRSTSSAEDLKYEFDAVAYLRTAYAGWDEPDPANGAAADGTDPREPFLRHKALWEAYEHPYRSILLIDEIDKAPRDFPNDLLLELDQHYFRHPFTDKRVDPKSGHPPIIVITSNAERRLPDAFLRRCVFHHIVLDKDLVKNAVMARAKTDFGSLDHETITLALERFWELRTLDRLQKRPATGEVLLWLAVLAAQGKTKQDLNKAVKLKDLPGLGVLLKDRDDLKRVKEVS